MIPVTTDDVGATAGRELVQALAAAVEARGRATLAIPGGTGPIPVLRWLVEGLPAELARATVLTWVDERHVAQGGPDWRGWDPESNRRLAWEHWLSRVEVKPTEVPLDAPGALDDARARVEADFRARVGWLDAVLLGVGPDGHVASLFPGRAALDDPGTVLAVPDSPKPPPERLTLGRTVIEDADLVVLVAMGKAKGPALAAAFSRDPASPLGRLEPRGRYVWVMDREASIAAAAAG